MELAAVGVSIAVFNLISKLLNFPVLNLTTSLVAEESIDAKGVCEIEMEKAISDFIPEENDAFISVKGKCCTPKILLNKSADFIKFWLLKF